MPGEDKTSKEEEVMSEVGVMQQPRTRRLDRSFTRAKKTWTPEELDILGNKYGLVSDRTLTRMLQRSPNAIKIAATRYLHINRKMNFYSATAASKALGIPCSKTIIGWADAGWLKVRRSVVNAGNYKAWRFHEEHIVKLIQAKPWLFDPKRMPEHYFRSVVLQEYEGNPWYTCAEAAPLLGVKTDDVVQRYIFKGWLTAVKKPGGPWQGIWIIRRSDIELFLANDPREDSRHELTSIAHKQVLREKGNPLRLSTIWSVLCPNCNRTVVVKADPALHGMEVQRLFTTIYTNGTCNHGMVVVIKREVAQGAGGEW